jgi:very-short-patch-repair endonuclease
VTTGGVKSAAEERLAWQLAQIGLVPTHREFRFHPERKWRADFAYPGAQLLVEVEGGRGRHMRYAGFEEDCVKYGEAVALGYRVLRVTADMVKDGRAWRLVQRALAVAAGLDRGGGRIAAEAAAAAVSMENAARREAGKC